MNYDLDLLVSEAIDTVNHFEGPRHDYLYRVEEDIRNIKGLNVSYEEVRTTLYDTQTDEIVLHLHATTKPLQENFLLISKQAAKALDPLLRFLEKNGVYGTLVDFDYNFEKHSRLQLAFK